MPLVKNNIKDNFKKIPLYIPDKQPRGVFEKYLDGKIEITEEKIQISISILDKKGRKRFLSYSSNCLVETVIGIAHLRWKSMNDRRKCIELQMSRNKGRKLGDSRWTEIVSMVSVLKQGKTLPLPALVHPSLHNHTGLIVIDGARRIIANIEASNTSFPVLIIKSV